MVGEGEGEGKEGGNVGRQAVNVLLRLRAEIPRGASIAAGGGAIALSVTIQEARVQGKAEVLL